MNLDALAWLVFEHACVLGVGFAAGLVHCAWKTRPRRPAVRPISLADAVERRRRFRPSDKS